MRADQRLTTAAPAADRDVTSVPEWFLDAVLLLVAVFAAAAVYTNAIPGEFVLDDTKQIAGNDLILQDRLLWTALTSDLWAFNRSPGAASASYWRPTLVLWWVGSVRVLGLNPQAWHIANILLHVAVILVAWGLLRRLSVARPVAGGIALLFAVHPVHVESVAWISGASDMLVSATMLGALWCVLSGRQRAGRAKSAAAIGLYVLAAGSKEIAVVFPLIVAAAVYVLPRPGASAARRRLDALASAVPFAAVAAVYLVARQLVIGETGVGRSTAMLGNVILTAPSVLAFYLRQIFFPAWIGPSYPLRPLSFDDLGPANLLIPAVVAAAATAAVLRLVRRDPARQIGAALWVLPLAPALNIGAFFREHIVHDRYLYLPTLGALMVAVPALAAGLRRLPWLAARAPWAAFLVAVVAGVPLSLQTIRYNSAWLTDLALAERGLRSDPDSTFNHTQHGVFLHAAGRREEALAAFDRAMEIQPWLNAYLGRAEVLLDLGRYGEAESDLRRALARYGPQFAAYERLAACHQRRNRLDDAVEVLIEARRELPGRRCAITDHIAVLLHEGSRPAEALAELEAVRGGVEAEYGAAARLVLFHLGMLYDELGRPDDARAALREYLEKTQGYADPTTVRCREQAREKLKPGHQPSG